MRRRDVPDHAVSINSAIDVISASGFRAHTALEPVDREIMNAVSRAQAGDNDAIRVLYLRYKDNVYGYVLSFVRDQHEAEDITQHVFLKLMSVIHKYRAREVPFTSWLLAGRPERRAGPHAPAADAAVRGGLRDRARERPDRATTCGADSSRRSRRCPRTSAT